MMAVYKGVISFLFLIAHFTHAFVMNWIEKESVGMGVLSFDL